MKDKSIREIEGRYSQTLIIKDNNGIDELWILNDFFVRTLVLRDKL